MNGLIRKDLYTIRKKMILFGFIIAGIVIFGELFALSTKYGNLAEVMKKDKENFLIYYKAAIGVVMTIPLTASFWVSQCFKEDDKADFYKVLKTFPIEVRKQVAARYLTCLCIGGAGVVTSLISGYLVTISTDFIAYRKLVYAGVTVFCLIVIYNMVLMPLYYYFKGKHTDTILGISFIACYLSSGIYFVFHVENNSDILKIWKMMKNGLTDYVFSLLAVTVLVTVLSYGISCMVERKRGNER